MYMQMISSVLSNTLKRGREHRLQSRAVLLQLTCCRHAGQVPIRWRRRYLFMAIQTRSRYRSNPSFLFCFSPLRKLTSTIHCIWCAEDRLGCVTGYETSTNAQGRPCTAGVTSPSSHKNQQTGNCARRVNETVSALAGLSKAIRTMRSTSVNCTFILIWTHSIARADQTVDQILHHALRRKIELLHCWTSQTH